MKLKILASGTVRVVSANFEQEWITKIRFLYVRNIKVVFSVFKTLNNNEDDGSRKNKRK